MTDAGEIFDSRAGLTDAGDPVGAFEAPNLSPQEYAEHAAQTMARILESTTLIEVVEVHASVGQVHLLGRVKAENEKKFVETVVKSSLIAMDKTCDGFIGKQYMLRNGRMLYGWVFSFGAEDLKSAARAIADAIDVIVPRREIVEVPLVGPPAPQSGGQKSGKRGAHPVR